MNIRQRMPKWAMVLAALGTVICAGILLICGGCALVGFYIYDDLRPDVSRDFTRVTGIEWPESATVTFTNDDHSMPLGDGESHLIFDIDGKELEKWLAEPPPWNMGEWRSSPIPKNVADNCLLRHNNSQLQRLLDSHDNQYVAVARGPEAAPWHNGRMLLLDLANNRVWLFVWDN